MKNTIQKLTLIVAISLTFLVGCTEFFDKIDDFNVGVTNTIFEQSAVIELQDYFGDQQNIIDTNLKVEFSGADAGKLVNEAGEFTLTETDGFIQLNVNPNKSTGVKELNFDITISGGDYVTTTYPVTLTDTVSHIKLPLVDVSKIEKNTDQISKSVALTSNTITDALTVETTSNEALNTSSVTLKADTQFKDSSGNAISGTNLNISVSNTDQFDDILTNTRSFEFKDQNGVEITDKIADLIFGFTNISMDIDGTSVKEFNKAIDVAITISSEANNPITDSKVILGDTFPIYTNDEENLEWTYHGIGTVIASDLDNTFNISFETTHLSNYSVVNFIDTGCIDYNYNITSTNLPSNFSAPFTIELKITTTKKTVIGVTKNEDGTFTYIFDEGITDEKLIELFNLDIINGTVTNIEASGFPNITKDEIQTGYEHGIYYSWNRLGYTTYSQVIEKLLQSGNDTYSYNYDEWFDNITIETQLFVKYKEATIRNNLSTIATIANCEFGINLSQDLTDYFNIGNLKNIAIDVAANCNNKTFVPDGFPFYVERENGVFSYEGTIKEGKMTLKGFELGKEYNFKTVYKGQSYFHKWTFDSETFTDKNFEVPQTACDALNI